MNEQKSHDYTMQEELKKLTEIVEQLDLTADVLVKTVSNNGLVDAVVWEIKEESPEPTVTKTLHDLNTKIHNANSIISEITEMLQVQLINEKLL